MSITSAVVKPGQRERFTLLGLVMTTEVTILLSIRPSAGSSGRISSSFLGVPEAVAEPGNEYTGISRGINDLGELLVEREDRSVTVVFAGEVSVRGVYGYT